MVQESISLDSLVHVIPVPVFLTLPTDDSNAKPVVQVLHQFRSTSLMALKHPCLDMLEVGFFRMCLSPVFPMFSQLQPANDSEHLTCCWSKATTEKSHESRESDVEKK